MIGQQPATNNVHYYGAACLCVFFLFRLSRMLPNPGMYHTSWTQSVSIHFTHSISVFRYGMSPKTNKEKKKQNKKRKKERDKEKKNSNNG